MIRLGEEICSKLSRRCSFSGFSLAQQFRLLGWTLIFAGIAQFVFALHSQTPGNFFLKSLGGALLELPESRWFSLQWQVSRLSQHC